ncbi:MAG: hypothetical protein ACRDPD_26420 [Streptosporangiaceae bacterium]
MSRPGPVIHAVISGALWPLIIIFSPVIVLAGEPVNRYVMRRVRRSASTARLAAGGHSGQPGRAAAARLSPRTSLLLADGYALPVTDRSGDRRGALVDFGLGAVGDSGRFDDALTGMTHRAAARSG